MTQIPKKLDAHSPHYQMINTINQLIDYLHELTSRIDTIAGNQLEMKRGERCPEEDFGFEPQDQPKRWPQKGDLILRNTFHQELQKARQEREIVNRLRQILAPQMALYKEYTEKEKTGEVDSSYVYDMAYEWFQNLSRGEFCSILEILTKDQSELDQPDALTK